MFLSIRMDLKNNETSEFQFLAFEGCPMTSLKGTFVGKPENHRLDSKVPLGWWHGPVVSGWFRRTPPCCFCAVLTTVLILKSLKLQQLFRLISKLGFLRRQLIHASGIYPLGVGIKVWSPSCWFAYVGLQQSSHINQFPYGIFKFKLPFHSLSSIIVMKT